MASSQSPRPLRVIVRTLLATPMVIALLAATGRTGGAGRSRLKG